MRYIAESSISFSIRVKGRESSVRVSFSSLSTGGSTFSTDSEALMEAMEQSPMYGTFYQRAPECMNESIRSKKATKPAATKKKITEVPEVEGWQEAAEYLSAQFGVSKGKLITPDEILREAEMRGVVFPKLN